MVCYIIYAKIALYHAFTIIVYDYNMKIIYEIYKIKAADNKEFIDNNSYLFLKFCNKKENTALLK